jgi:hypothetical protein
MIRYKLKIPVVLTIQSFEAKEGLKMNKTKYLFVALISILSLILWGSRAFAQTGSSTPIESKLPIKSPLAPLFQRGEPIFVPL